MFVLSFLSLEVKGGKRDGKFDALVLVHSKSNKVSSKDNPMGWHCDILDMPARRCSDALQQITSGGKPF